MMILGYDWPRLHAAVNDLPAALLPMAVIFEGLGMVMKRESLRAAGFWCLVAGVVGGGVAILAGEMAEDVVAHGDASHAIMETHETFAIVVTVLFGLLAVWRILRRNRMTGPEQGSFIAAGAIGIGILLYTAKLGGSLVFEHALGVDSAHMQSSLQERAGHHHHEGEADDDDDHDHDHHDTVTAPAKHP
jgi:uncharacterized membrane protein